jgi:hypothetical protein
MQRRPTTTSPPTPFRSLGGNLVGFAAILALALVLAGWGAASPETLRPGNGGGDGGDGDDGGGDTTPAPVVQNTIAYVTGAPGGDQIRLIAPDGSGDRLLWPKGGTDPEITHRVTSVAWRPDGRALAFTSSHEMACSWYHADVYLVRSDGDGTERVTNAPACAGLAGLPTGRVTVGVHNLSFSSGLFQVYVQGARNLEQILLGPGAGGTVTFEAVADLGAVLQPAVAILGGYRWIGGAVVDVVPGATVHAGDIVIGGEGHLALGAGEVAWHADGAELAYVFGECAGLYRIAPPAAGATGTLGSVGTPLLSGDDDGVHPCAMDWGPTEATKDDYLHVAMGFWDDRGIYLASEGGGVGTRIVEVMESGYGEFVDDVAWLPGGSGFLFSGFLFPRPDPFDYDYAGNLYHYDFARGDFTRVTAFTSEFVRRFSVAPDGEHVVFELQQEIGDEASDLWIVALDGSGLRLLVAGARAPDWGP